MTTTTPPPSLDDLKRPSPHEADIRSALGGRAFFRGDGPVFDHPLYLLGFFNRCGSNLLREALTSCDHFSGFGEHLNAPMVLNVIERDGLSGFPGYFLHCSQEARKAGRIHGFKASWSQIAMLLRLGIDRMYPEVRVIHMTRQDVLAQAVSFWIAFQTKQWTSEVAATAQEPVFDAQRIQDMLNGVLFSEQAIAMLCATRGIARHVVRYEEFVADQVGVMQGIGDFAGLDLSGWVPAAPKLKRQSTALNDSYRDRFIAYFNAQMDLPYSGPRKT